VASGTRDEGQGVSPDKIQGRSCPALEAGWGVVGEEGEKQSPAPPWYLPFIQAKSPSLFPTLSLQDPVKNEEAQIQAD